MKHLPVAKAPTSSGPGPSRSTGRRNGTTAVTVASAGLVVAAASLLVTMIETDSGWEDAIWRYGSWSKTLAVVTTCAGTVAAVSAFLAARRLRSSAGSRSKRWFAGSLAAELTLFAVWVVLLYTAPE